MSMQNRSDFVRPGTFIAQHIIIWGGVLVIALMVGSLIAVQGLVSTPIDGLSATMAFFTRLPRRFVLWVVLVIAYFLLRRYAMWGIAILYGTDVSGLRTQIRKQDSNESPSILLDGFSLGLAATLATVGLFAPMATIHMLVVKVALFMIGAMVMAIWQVRRNGTTSLDEWLKLFREPGTDGPTRDAANGIIVTGFLGFISILL